jgi:hypothetical protein
MLDQDDDLEALLLISLNRPRETASQVQAELVR